MNGRQSSLVFRSTKTHSKTNNTIKSQHYSNDKKGKTKHRVSNAETQKLSHY